MRGVSLEDLLAGRGPGQAGKLVYVGLTPPRAPGRQNGKDTPLALVALPAPMPPGHAAWPSASFSLDDFLSFAPVAHVREAVLAHRDLAVVLDMPLRFLSIHWLRQLGEAGVKTCHLPLVPGRFFAMSLRRATLLTALPYAVQRGLAVCRARLSSWLLGSYARPVPGRAAAALLPLVAKTLAEGRRPHRSIERLALQAPGPLPGPTRALRISHLIGGLGPGGAERQLCYLLRGLAQRGFYRQTLVSFYPLTGANGHYAPLLDGVDIDRRVMPHPFACDQEPFDRIPARLRYGVYAAYRWFKEHPADIVHAWMDYSAIIGGVGALLAGVPRIVLSSRNLCPLRFPYIYAYWYRPWYELLAKSPRVHFLNNSTAGAADYADWLGFSASRFTVIRNAVDANAYQTASREAVDAFRAELGLSPGAPLVAGIFRLSDEKRPLLFVEVLKRLLAEVPGARVVHTGMGPREDVFRQALDKAGLSGRVTLLGRREDIPTLLGATTALLLTSRFEGTPNVLLEAQLCGCPVVTTRAGGAPDCLLPGRTGFLHESDDVQGMADSLALLCRDAPQRQAMGRQAARFVREHFSIERVMDQHIEFYAKVANSGASGHNPSEFAAPRGLVSSP